MNLLERPLNFYVSGEDQSGPVASMTAGVRDLPESAAPGNRVFYLDAEVAEEIAALTGPDVPRVFAVTPSAIPLATDLSIFQPRA